MFKALIVGCGNIGAMYDLHNKRILTHAKGYSKNGNFSLSFYDADFSKAKAIAQKYNGVALQKLSKPILKSFDIISICTPTDLHFKLLKQALELNIKVIICEKPIAYDLKELSELNKSYSKSTSKVLVNYLRRFQPEYIKLKGRIEQSKIQNLQNVIIKYKRGIINNASHALDTLEFLFEEKVHLKNTKIQNKFFDAFKNDPTCSLSGKWGRKNIFVTGLPNLNYPLFEIELYFENKTIIISDSGNTIETSELKKPTVKKTNCLNNYMIAVIKYAESMLKDQNVKDNFVNSLQLNERLLNYLENE
jgi:predicted dehydrogenase